MPSTAVAPPAIELVPVYVLSVVKVTVPEAMLTFDAPLPPEMRRDTCRSVPERFNVPPLVSDSGVALVASVPVPALLVMVPPLPMVTTLPTLAPPAISNLLAPTAMVPLPASLPAPLMRSVPADTVVPPL